MLAKLLRSCLLLTLLLAACQTGPSPSKLPLQDGFDDPNSGWETTLDNDQFRIDYDNSALHIVVNALDSTAWTVAGEQVSDFILDVDATQTEGPDDNHYGVIVRFLDERNFYRLDVSGDGYYSIQRYKDGDWEKLVDWPPLPTDIINQGATTNHLRVIANGSKLTWVVNGTIVAEVDDVDILSGDVGFTAGSFFAEAGVHVAFDNFEVNPLEGSE